MPGPQGPGGICPRGAWGEGGVVGIKNAGLLMQRAVPFLRGMCLAFTVANPCPVDVI